jgi:CHAD domain-containing protein
MKTAEAAPSIAPRWRVALVSDLDESAKLLESDELPLQKRIKLVRSRLKRSQAMLRLARASIKAGNHELAEQLHVVRRNLGGARDAQAMLEVLDDLRPGRSPKRRSPDRKLIQDWRSWLSFNQARALQMLDDDQIAIEIARLREIAKSLGKRSTDHAAGQEIAFRFRKDYRRARKRMPGSHAARCPQDLHRFRKAVIDHRYQLEFLLPVASERLSALEKLRRLLGTFQDLEMLKRAVVERNDGPDLDRILKLVRKRQKNRVKKAKHLARRLFGGKAQDALPRDLGTCSAAGSSTPRFNG